MFVGVPVLVGVGVGVGVSGAVVDGVGVCVPVAVGVNPVVTEGVGVLVVVGVSVTVDVCVGVANTTVGSTKIVSPVKEKLESRLRALKSALAKNALVEPVKLPAPMAIADKAL